ncbi:hypothetical protein QVD17_06215 [Tagetes erecta]|uniref:Uncharacterized protein n=1 Tax=Tagetes erecta TaxID=13708 RepID=A0AAD8LDD0_TARER|nr:hypothetical protein QVD17_06215 [Tagetes erecta]
MSIHFSLALYSIKRERHTPNTILTIYHFTNTNQTSSSPPISLTKSSPISSQIRLNFIIIRYNHDRKVEVGYNAGVVALLV